MFEVTYWPRWPNVTKVLLKNRKRQLCDNFLEKKKAVHGQRHMNIISIFLFGHRIPSNLRIRYTHNYYIYLHVNECADRLTSAVASAHARIAAHIGYTSREVLKIASFLFIRIRYNIHTSIPVTGRGRERKMLFSVRRNEGKKK